MKFYPYKVLGKTILKHIFQETGKVSFVYNILFTIYTIYTI